MHSLTNSAAFEKMSESESRHPEIINEGQFEQISIVGTAPGDGNGDKLPNKRDSGFPSYQGTPADDEVFDTSTSTQLETALEAQAKGFYTVPCSRRRRAPTIPPGFEAEFEFYTHAPPLPAPPTFAEQYGWPSAPPSQEAVDAALAWIDGKPVIQEPLTAFDIRRLNARGVPLRPALNAEAAPFVPVQQQLECRQQQQGLLLKPKSRLFENGKRLW